MDGVYTVSRASVALVRIAQLPLAAHPDAMDTKVGY